jgi:hypothetical protein
VLFIKDPFSSCKPFKKLNALSKSKVFFVSVEVAVLSFSVGELPPPV